MAAGDESAIRARWPQRVFQWLDAHAPGVRDGLHERLGAEAIAAIVDSSAVDWLPMQAHLDVLEAWRELAGAQRYQRAYVDAAAHALELPIFESMVSSLVRLVGRRAMVRGFGRGWSMVMRGTGKPRVRQHDDEPGTWVHFVEVPSTIAMHVAYGESISAVLEALMSRGGFPGRVETDRRAASSGELRYHMIPDVDDRIGPKSKV